MTEVIKKKDLERSQDKSIYLIDDEGVTFGVKGGGFPMFEKIRRKLFTPAGLLTTVEIVEVLSEISVLNAEKIETRSINGKDVGFYKITILHDDKMLFDAIMQGMNVKTGPNNFINYRSYDCTQRLNMIIGPYGSGKTYSLLNYLRHNFRSSQGMFVGSPEATYEYTNEQDTKDLQMKYYPVSNKRIIDFLIDNWGFIFKANYLIIEVTEITVDELEILRYVFNQVVRSSFIFEMKVFIVATSQYPELISFDELPSVESRAEATELIVKIIKTIQDQENA